MFKLPVRIKENLSQEQMKNLIRKLESSELYELSPLRILSFQFGWYVNVREIKEGHPKNFFGNYLPIGFIGKNYAEIVNRSEVFPEDYYSQFIKICDSI